MKITCEFSSQNDAETASNAIRSQVGIYTKTTLNSNKSVNKSSGYLLYPAFTTTISTPIVSGFPNDIVKTADNHVTDDNVTSMKAVFRPEDRHKVMNIILSHRGYNIFSLDE